jgi:hypothetical protein
MRPNPLSNRNPRTIPNAINEDAGHGKGRLLAIDEQGAVLWMLYPAITGSAQVGHAAATTNAAVFSRTIRRVNLCCS